MTVHLETTKPHAHVSANTKHIGCVFRIHTQIEAMVAMDGGHIHHRTEKKATVRLDTQSHESIGLNPFLRSILPLLPIFRPHSTPAHSLRW